MIPRLLLLNLTVKLILLQEMKYFNTWPYLWPNWHYLLKVRNKYLVPSLLDSKVWSNVVSCVDTSIYDGMETFDRRHT
ncbi:hypothetical protein L1987_02236 [Smallanthus sonchifolius]|uniref:Uncharacterized protein n=1 Tax=Smallanthus sonchifolius TaxID=185202 RepID=A0ACB9K7F0_9ASTR|nr:hypothetical protein L1987_02236 [Smallanthus sonchifolius]